MDVLSCLDCVPCVAVGVKRHNLQRGKLYATIMVDPILIALSIDAEHFLETLMHEQLLRDIEELIPVLRRYGRFLACNGDDADDLVHNCLERAVSHVEHLREGTNLRTWLLTIMRNCLLDAKRHEKGRVEVALDHVPGEETSSPGLRAAFLRLPDSQKLALICVVFEGLPYDEAAEVLGIPVGSVKSRVARARDTLRRTVAAEPLQRSA
jgi:RNA polymerase sigma factor (sigma-70 family)